MDANVAGSELKGFGRDGAAEAGSRAHVAHGRAASGTPARRAFLSLVRTGDDPVPLVLRAALALVMFPHGAQKLLGWFGGPGFSGAMGHLTGDYGLPVVIALLVVAIEFFAPVALALGLLSRVAAAGIAVVMIGAVVTTHLPYGFFMNWFGTQAGEGFEYHILAVALAAAVVVRGGGALSLDRRITEQEAAR